MRRVRAGFASLFVALAACLGACSDDPALTQIMVMVRSNVDGLDSVEIRVEGMGKAQTATADVAKQKLPRTLAVVHRGGPLGPIVIRARGLRDDQLVVERAARLSFVKGRNVTLVLDLVQACEQVACTGKNQTCIDGGCKSDAVDSTKLKDWPGSTGKVDAGTIYVAPDDGGTDGGFELDAGDAGALEAGPVEASVDASADAATDALVDAGPLVCDDNHADCDDDGVDCETSLVTLANCGGCGDKCEFDPAVIDPKGTLSCPTRVCKVSCPTDRFDLDGDLRTGCDGLQFSIVPSHFDPNDATLRASIAPALTVDCSATIDFDGATLPGTVSICGHDVTPLVVAQVGGPDLVVIPLAGLDVPSGGALQLAGSRPVVFVVFGNASVAGTLTASAVGAVPGAGGNVSCSTGAASAGATGGGGGGGGGGGFGSVGGGGGDSNSGANGAGGGTVEGTADLAILRGGCGGGAGGNTGGAAGAGGGALQLSVAGTLTVSGTFAAACGGGAAPATATQSGGGGGGSGGAVLLEAASVDIAASAWVTANGGSGAEASRSGLAGNPGADGAPASATPAVGGSGADNAGNGGAGAAGVSAAGNGGDGGSGLLGANPGGGGGGGGGVGRVWLHGATCGVAGGTSPAPQLACP